MEKRTLLELHDAHIERGKKSLAEIQREFKDAARDSSILIVDNSMDYSVNIISENLKMLRERGLAEVADLYVEKVFGGRIPRDSRDIFQNFFGSGIRLSFLDVAKQDRSVDEDPQAIVLTGSPANIGSAIYGEDITNTHMTVIERAREIYTWAAEENLPVLGFCFGHQLMATERGGFVRKMFDPRSGMQHMRVPTNYSTELVLGLTGRQPEKKEGYSAINHAENVDIVNLRQSGILLRSSDSEGIIHGLVHTAGDAFVGNAEKDKAMLEEMLFEGRHVGIGVQGHPEADSTYLLNFKLAVQEENFGDKKWEKMMTDQLLALMTRFLARHKKFKK